MNVQPGKRLPKYGAVRERTLRPRIGPEFAQPALQPYDLPQPLDVAAGERQLTQA